MINNTKNRFNSGSLVQVFKSNYCILRNIRKVFFFTLSLYCHWSNLFKTEQNQNKFHLTVSGHIQNGAKAFASVK